MATRLDQITYTTAGVAEGAQEGLGQFMPKTQLSLPTGSSYSCAAFWWVDYSKKGEGLYTGASWHKIQISTYWEYQ